MKIPLKTRVDQTRHFLSTGTTVSKTSESRFVTEILIFQLVVALVVLLDIPIARQVICFIYLVTIPGLLILRLLGLEKLNVTQTVLFSIGLSISFLMLLGLFLNEVSISIGLSRPLSATHLVTITGVVVLFLCLVTGIRKRIRSPENKSIKPSAPLMLFLLLPILGISGSFLAAKIGWNILLIVMILAVSAFVCALSLFKKISRLETYYPYILFTITFALVFMSLFAKTDYVVLWDEATEYYFFRLTQTSLSWNSSLPTGLPSSSLYRVNGMISVTILPTILSEVLNLEGTWVFKIFYPLIVTLVPVALYQFFRQSESSRIAFLSSFFFILSSVGRGWGNDMQMVGQFFYALLFVTIFDKNIPSLPKNILFIFFGGALILSHYSLTYIFMFSIALVWLYLRIAKKESGSVKTMYVIGFLVMAFSWYIYVSKSAAFNILRQTWQFVYNTLFSDLFNIESRGTDVARLLGTSGTLPGQLLLEASTNLIRISSLLILIGFIGMIVKRNKTTIGKEYFMFIWLNMLILILNLVLPGLSPTFLMARFYQTTLLILAPLCLLGGEVVFKLALRMDSRKSAALITLFVLVPSFLFQSGFLYEVTGSVSWSVALSGYRLDRLDYYNQFTNGPEVHGAMWVSTHADKTNTRIYTDDNGLSGALSSYGLVAPENLVELDNMASRIDPGSFIYLRLVNVIYGKMGLASSWNTSDIAPFLKSQNMVYSNGGCDIYGGVD